MRTAPLPDPAFAHLLWQTAVGAWPIERERLQAYVEKAAREAAHVDHLGRPGRARSRRRCTAMVDRIYDDPALRAEVADFAARDHAAPAGPTRSGQKLVQLTMPGVPDVYQGTELWDYSLVDPDNRRPVDFAARRELLARLDDGWLPPVDADGRGEAAGHQPDAAAAPATGRSCSPATGRCSRDGPARPSTCVAFDRGGAIAVATRLPVRLSRHGGWRDTDAVTRRPRAWTDVVHRTTVYGGSRRGRWPTCCDRYPVALLVEGAA